MSVGGTVVSQSGASGGTVVRQRDGALLAVIATASDAANTASRDLRAITLAHVDRSLAAEGRGGIAALLTGDLSQKLEDFNTNTAPALAKKLLEALKNKVPQPLKVGRDKFLAYRTGVLGVYTGNKLCIPAIVLIAGQPAQSSAEQLLQFSPRVILIARRGSFESPEGGLGTLYSFLHYSQRSGHPKTKKPLRGLLRYLFSTYRTTNMQNPSS